jgi:hypothetical protein
VKVGPALIALACIGSAHADSLAPRPIIGDYALKLLGPRRVEQGHAIYLELRGTERVEDRVLLSVSGLPPDSRFELPDLKAQCCLDDTDGYYAYSVPFETALEVTTGPHTPPGTYTITVGGKGKQSGLARQTSYQIVVVKPTLAPRPARLDLAPAIPSLAEWERNMRTYGEKLCADGAIEKCGTWEGCAWYYDGERVFFQVADYLKEPKFNACAQRSEAVYRDQQVLPSKGKVQGFRIFPHGLVMDFARTGDASSKEAALLLTKEAAYASGPLAPLVSEARSREVAYNLGAFLAAETLGAPRNPRAAIYVDLALGHLDQWFVSKTYDDAITPFMVGLTAEALIAWWDRTADPRVPLALRPALDWLWQNAWVPAERGFWYEWKKDAPSPGNPSPALNLLIAPAYAWVYARTGEVRYREEGDQIFAGGVSSSFLDSGKNYSQNYRWSFDYVRWRTPPPHGKPGAPSR